MKILKVKTTKDNDLTNDRNPAAWATWFEISFHGGRIWFELNQYITMFKGEKQDDDWATQFKFLSIHLNPLKWNISQDHAYYDQPHCFWQFGPFTIGLSGRWDCKKCRE